MSSQEPRFLKKKHIRYWLRCAKTFLPDAYTSSDSNRMTLAFFIVSALDLLGILQSKFEKAERQGWVDWIYSCQVESGGFRGFTGSKFGSRSPENEHWDPANVPATFFALLALIILGDRLSAVKRTETLKWLQRLQREDGSFGETLGESGRIEGGSDLRFCSCAAGIRYLLQGRRIKESDIQVDRLTAYIAACQTYDGGFSTGPGHESHSGLTYCAIAALKLLDSFPQADARSVVEGDLDPNPAGISVPGCVSWIASRQTTYLEEIELDEQDPLPASEHEIPYPNPSDASSPKSGILSFSEEDLHCVGFNGRANKVADTCYCFWNTAALEMLNTIHIIDKPRMERYLLQKTQHIVGGFGKGVKEPPDIMHSYLGLAALATVKYAGFGTFEPEFCTSFTGVTGNLSEISWFKE